MNLRDRVRTLEHIRAALRAIEREYSDEEVRAAAIALGLEHQLPDPQEELPLGIAA